MDARERLRAYLEQRRDMGERELVLDGLSVEDVMRLVGAAQAAGDGLLAPMPVESTAPRDADAGPVSEAPGVPDGDWRKALGERATPAAPKASGRAFPPPPEPPPAEGAVPATQGSAARPVDPIDAPPGIVVGDGARTSLGTLDVVQSLDAIAELVRACSACGLAKLAKNAVPGEGNPHADFVLVGEAPGQNEDESGRPFVGIAGQLLTKIIEAIHLTREQVYICNVIKHRPPNNRNPLPEEIAACSPFLRRQIELLRPKVIVALGAFAAQTLLETKTPIGKLRGQVHRYYGVPVIATYHPAALLRNSSWKRPTWEDVQLARRILDRASGA